MMNSFEILGHNRDFLMNAYGMGPLVALMLVVALLDLGLKGWAMWRAARMNKTVWFIFLLIVNSAGILPTVFLLMTNTEYMKKFLTTSKLPAKKKKSGPSDGI